MFISPAPLGLAKNRLKLCNFLSRKQTENPIIFITSDRM